MSLPLAYFLTSTYYGQRLHGDERGSTDDAHNTRGTPLLDPDPIRERRARARMCSGPVTFTPPMRDIADGAVVQLCIDRGWKLLARNIRMTHFHVVVNCRGQVSPERALSNFKARITRDLRSARLVAPDARLWTEHGSTLWINHYSGFYAAVGYVNDWQSGPHREILEEHRKLIRQQVRELKAWLRENGLPRDDSDERA